jgi:1-phosphatidylinositol-3-phosphate 5-kinase
VLLDENLMEHIRSQPLHVDQGSERVLREGIRRDTAFLANLNVMDYSLLLGVDEERHELVVGIVDFIRTFTWDKKLEVSRALCAFQCGSS